ncbi:5-formyltetrahydrofolate cyclo-ligase [Corynebacterium genitalium ATCC 33030]|uniref:5-formyltetrahydrofolate cyclo-ligase n=1 Tax=Corynebacterium genitalium ATCC 33030 TaxID=585529 RepID=D7WE93_9CORY|nr:5-formyltetrahydrofolate cyclo-ligase [Corynebacterium genitalium]EFK54447.1 5-formyltetrahydrofolate cyclo-ligase [Corynebacterium genitalium ATCC 33030]UUA90060.1 5-formyltetrahydrofolate cyclo-ligase [Corynebacterium genitalium ATCC 33030]
MDSKGQLRAVARQRRRVRENKALIDAAVRDHLLTHLRSCARVAAYSPMPTEPGGEELPDVLAATGLEVFLPVTLGAGVLEWALHVPGQLARGAHFGITEPTGERFPSSMLSSCDVVIVPALGVDRRGMRLGQGAGYYDRALVHAGAVPRIALVYDDEVHDVLPSEPHDKPVDGAVTPQGFLRFKGTSPGAATVQ